MHALYAALRAFAKCDLHSHCHRVPPLRFTRRHLEGSQAPINVTGENNILFAFSATESNTIDYHGANK